MIYIGSKLKTDVSCPLRNLCCAPAYLAYQVNFARKKSILATGLVSGTHVTKCILTVFTGRIPISCNINEVRINTVKSYFQRNISGSYQRHWVQHDQSMGCRVDRGHRDRQISPRCWSWGLVESVIRSWQGRQGKACGDIGRQLHHTTMIMVMWLPHS